VHRRYIVLHYRPVFTPDIFLGRGIFPEKGTYIPPFPLKNGCQIVCSESFLDQDSELHTYHGNIPLMDNEHMKLFVIKQSKWCKFLPKMHQNTFGISPPEPARGTYALRQTLQRQWGAYLGRREGELGTGGPTNKGTEKGEKEGREGRREGTEREGKGFSPKASASRLNTGTDRHVADRNPKSHFSLGPHFCTSSTAFANILQMIPDFKVDVKVLGLTTPCCTEDCRRPRPSGVNNLPRVVVRSLRCGLASNRPTTACTTLSP